MFPPAKNAAYPLGEGGRVPRAARRIMPLPQSIVLCECWARDGLQSIPKLVATEHKIEMINRIVASGVKKLEVTASPTQSFFRNSRTTWRYYAASIARRTSATSC